MNFSEFAQLLFPYKSNGCTQSDFVVYLTNYIISPSMLKNRKQPEEEWDYTPFDDMEADTLSKIYSGTRQISKAIASKILHHLDKRRFERFIEKTPPETIKLIRIDLQKKEIDCSDEEVPLICADIFVSILNDCANKERKHRQKTSVNQVSQFAQATNLTSDFQMDSTSPPAETSPSVITIDNQTKEVRSIWDSDPPEPVFMPEEFYKCFNKYAIADFIELDPMDLILINYMVAEKRPDGEGLIRSAIQFIKEIESDMQRAEVSSWSEKVCKAISAFTKSLREYIDFLMKNAESPDFSILPFLLEPVDANEFEREAVKHRRKLQSIYKQITAVDGRWQGLQMYAYFPG